MARFIPTSEITSVLTAATMRQTEIYAGVRSHVADYGYIVIHVYMSKDENDNPSGLCAIVDTAEGWDDIGTVVTGLTTHYPEGDTVMVLSIPASADPTLEPVLNPTPREFSATCPGCGMIWKHQNPDLPDPWVCGACTGKRSAQLDTFRDAWQKFINAAFHVSATWEDMGWLDDNDDIINHERFAKVIPMSFDEWCHELLIVLTGSDD